MSNTTITNTGANPTAQQVFLERHNITNEDFNECIKTCCDYEFNYDDAEGWVRDFGRMMSQGLVGEDREFVIHISGGGDPNTPNGFEDWVIKPKDTGLGFSGGEAEMATRLEYYVRYGGSIPDDEQKGKKIVSCPEGDYVSFQDNNYELKGGEMDFGFLLELGLARAPQPEDEEEQEVSEENDKLKAEKKELQFKLDYALNGIDPDCIDEWKKDKKKIEDLEKANKKLKEIFLDKDDENFNSMDAVLQQAEDDYTDKYKMEEEIEKLKEENKELKEGVEALNRDINDRVVIEDIAEAFGSDEGEDFDWESEISGLVKDKGDLVKANEFLKVIAEKQTEIIDNIKSELNNLMCVINHLKIDHKKVLKELEADCEPDAYDCL